eukprot:CAMPEP_0202700922 /NCGR_PEP_ID=MMETSP1385-20130828/14048_1 /ASSEMBLY_ACC=CAM_ASM_000861 /TAXON_ID=933848 /ORGANISM="Elphidium margaritaceum" /LENGTH=82 /DNA_ID=CAMNT_0049358213 /DNA_START=740 /DNA_END=985 /DNA_ORIENTATION=-
MNIPCVVQLQSYLYNWALADEFSDNYHLRWTRVGGVVADHDDEAIASFLEVDGEADAVDESSNSDKKENDDECIEDDADVAW